MLIKENLAKYLAYSLEERFYLLVSETTSIVPVLKVTFDKVLNKWPELRENEPEFSNGLISAGSACDRFLNDLTNLPIPLQNHSSENLWIMMRGDLHNGITSLQGYTNLLNKMCSKSAMSPEIQNELNSCNELANHLARCLEILAA